MAKQRSEITDGAPVMDKRRKKRVSVYLNDDGSPDWSGVSDEQRAMLGGVLPTPEAEAEPIPPEMVGLLLKTVTSIEAAVLARSMDLEPALVHQAFAIPEPMEGPMCETGARVLQKYMGGASRYQDEMVLAALLISWQGAAIGQLRAFKAEKLPTPEPPPAPIEQRESRVTPTEAPPPGTISIEMVEAARGGFISDDLTIGE